MERLGCYCEGQGHKIWIFKNDSLSHILRTGSVRCAHISLCPRLIVSTYLSVQCAHGWMCLRTQPGVHMDRCVHVLSIISPQTSCSPCTDVPTNLLYRVRLWLGFVRSRLGLLGLGSGISVFRHWCSFVVEHNCMWAQ